MYINCLQKISQYNPINWNFKNTKQDYINRLPNELLKEVFIYSCELEVKNVSKRWNHIVESDEKLKHRLIVGKLVSHFNRFFKGYFQDFYESKCFFLLSPSFHDQLKNAYQKMIVSSICSIAYEKNLGNLHLEETLCFQKETPNRRAIILHGVYDKTQDPNAKSVCRFEGMPYIPIDRIAFWTNCELPNKMLIAVQIAIDELNSAIEGNKFSDRRIRLNLFHKQITCLLRYPISFYRSH